MPKSKKRVSALGTPLPIRITIRDDITVGEAISLGLRMEMLSLCDEKTPEHGSVCTGTGLGSDYIILEWRGRKAFVRGLDLFKAWVATFAPEDAERMP